MPAPIMTETFWYCPMCQLPKGYVGFSYLIGNPIIHMICERCWITQLISQMKVPASTVRSRITLNTLVGNQQQLRDIIQSLEHPETQLNK